MKSLPIPKRGFRVYDLLKMAGMSLDDWPHANAPNFNMRWAWIEGDIAVVNVWTDNIMESAELEGTYTASYTARGQKRKWAKDTDNTYKEISRRRLLVHVLLKERNTNKSILDTEQWSAVYDELTGVLLLTRGDVTQFEDQHGDFRDDSSVVQTEAAKRSNQLRLAALKRSRGICEYCREPGFLTVRGTLFAEVHHIQFLSDKGLDTLDNLVVLCPNDHRRAHHSIEGEEMKQFFLNLRKFSLGL
ncbi:HNH endonuclease [Lelliottia amnigena]|uniref:HNH endonuclease signature motif containing protein n=1 Tax=Lelliottia TaxID=1330545 RepID=UPI00192C9176|nr:MULTISPECIES: HNH endonuclease signature motif containing protein [Lelliottia]MBL5885577.1 HNH endonuclease [Lelliottia aquatilis]MBL5923149.1 HNH endonuclease [Lelliottia amnigena]MBL5932065.1 HNH endonuclease [Lelliottia amnigena]